MFSGLGRHTVYALASLPAGLASLFGGRTQPVLASRLLGVDATGTGRARIAAHALLSLPLNVLSLLVAGYGWSVVILNLCYPLRSLIGWDASPEGAWGGPTLAGAWAVHAAGGLVMLALLRPLLSGLTRLQARVLRCTLKGTMA